MNLLEKCDMSNRYSREKRVRTYSIGQPECAGGLDATSYILNLRPSSLQKLQFIVELRKVPFGECFEAGYDALACKIFYFLDRGRLGDLHL